MTVFQTVHHDTTKQRTHALADPAVSSDFCCRSDVCYIRTSVYFCAGI